METGGYFKQVHLVGGDLALDFVNTQTGPPDGPVDGDALDGYDDFLSWSRQMGTMGEQQAEALALVARARPAAASAAFRKAVGARSYLWETFASLARQQDPPRCSTCSGTTRPAHCATRGSPGRRGASAGTGPPVRTSARLCGRSSRPPSTFSGPAPLQA